MIEALIAHLATTAVSNDAYNQYENDNPANTVRRTNLIRYFAQVFALGPSLVLVAEAPGYRGCRRTGVPFTSGSLLLEGIDPPGLFGYKQGYELDPSDGPPLGEQTATIIWRELRRHKLVALGWNAWPFHPHRPGMPNTNRTPRAAELRQGYPFLEQVLALAPGLPVVAVGNSAHQSLSAIGMPHRRVRHPAQGGATRFAYELAMIVNGDP